MSNSCEQLEMIRLLSCRILDHFPGFVIHSLLFTYLKSVRIKRTCMTVQNKVSSVASDKTGAYEGELKDNR